MVKKIAQLLGGAVAGFVGFGFCFWLINLELNQPVVSFDDKTGEVFQVEFPKIGEDGYDVIKTDRAPEGPYRMVPVDRDHLEQIVPPPAMPAPVPPRLRGEGGRIAQTLPNI